MQGLQYRPGDGEPVQGRRAAADLIHHHQAARAGLMQDRGGFRHLHHEGAAAARQVIRRADAGEQPVDDADGGGGRRHRQPRLRQDHDQRVLAQEGRFAGHVRAGQQHEALGRGKIAVVRHENGLAGQGGLHHRMPAGGDLEGLILRDHGAAPSRRLGQPRGTLEQVDTGERRRAGGDGRAITQGARDEMVEDHPLPRRRPLRRSRDLPVKLAELGAGEPRPGGEALPQHQLRPVAQLLGRR